MDELYGIIYKVTNKINGKAYIGQTTKSLEQRMSCHVSKALHNKNNSYFHNAIKKYGIENFDLEIISKCSSFKLLNSMEIFYIDYYDTFNNGYNLILGGCGLSAEARKKLSMSLIGKKVGFKHTEETKRRMSEIKTGKNHPNYGKHPSAETRRKMSESQMGKKNHNYGKKTPFEIRRKISKANSGKNSYLFGKHLSDETKKKLSIARIGKYTGKDGPHTVIVVIGDKRFDTRDEAAKFVGITSAAIRYRILHKTKWLDYHYIK